MLRLESQRGLEKESSRENVCEKFLVYSVIICIFLFREIEIVFLLNYLSIVIRESQQY